MTLKLLFQKSLHGQTSLGRKFNRFFAVAALSLATMGATAQAGNLTRGSISNSPGAAGAPASQTSTTATTSTAQASQAAAFAQRAALSMQRSVQSLQALQAQQNAQSAARNLALGGPNNLGAASQSLPLVKDGLIAGGLVPGVSTDPSDPTTVAASAPVTVNANGTAFVTLAANTALTLPPSATASSQITVSGTGTVGTITTGGTITPLTAGVATMAAPGSTISLTKAGTVTFASGSAAVPSAFSTYAYITTPATPTTPAVTAPTPASWSGIGGLTQSTYSPSTGQTSGATTVTVTQTAQQALLTWQTFNIGKNTTLDFDQSLGGANVGNWVAINKVAANIAPSQILGSLQAPGQVYVINQNGIIFGGGSQVNTHALVASSLPINDNLVNTGLLNNSADLSYLFSSLESVQSNNTTTPLFTPPLSVSASPASPTAIGGTAPDGGKVANVSTGGVLVEAGAQIQSPTNVEHVGGRVALIGPSVENNGTIYTPDGQTILAAGFQVGFLTHDSTDPSLRGLDVYLGAATDSTGAYNSNALIQSGLFPTAGIASNGIAINDPATLTLGVPATTQTYGQTGAPLLGLIEAPRADVYMAGANIQQNSIIDSSTSVSLNGRVDMVSAFDEITYLKFDSGANANVTAGLPASTGSVTFGPGSVTQILPEQTTSTVVGNSLALPSLVEIQGQAMEMGENALLLAPGASVAKGKDSSGKIVTISKDPWDNALNAGVTFTAGAYGRDTQGVVPIFAATQGTITLEQGSAIDVSGSADVGASVAENIVAVQLRGTELANSPVQQNGPLRGQTVYVDMSQYGAYNGVNWIGSPIGDLSGYAALIQHTAPELTVNGGSISLTAGTSVSLNSGATLDVSGGAINYGGAYVKTTKVVTSNGQILGISQAAPNLVYAGILTDVTVASQKWGVSQTIANPALAPQFEQGYIQGGNGGTVSITAPNVTLNGTLSGNTIAGVRQQQIQSTLPTTFGSTSGLSMIQSIYGAPQASTLNIDFSNQQVVSGIATRIPDSSLNISFRPGEVAGFNPSANEFDLSTDLVNVDGFGNLKLTDDFGSITVPADAPFNMMPGGVLSFYSTTLNVFGNISLPGGTLNFSALGDFNLGTSAVAQLDQLAVAATPGKPGTPASAVTLNGPGTLILQTGLSAGSSVAIGGSGGYVLTPGDARTSFQAGDILSNLPGGSMVVFSGGGGSMTLVAGSVPVVIPAGVGFTTGTSTQLESTGGSIAQLDQPASAVTLTSPGALTLQSGLSATSSVTVGGSGGYILKPGGTAQLESNWASIAQLVQPASAVTLTNPGALTLQSGLSATSSVTVGGSGGYVLTPGGTKTPFNVGDSLSNLPSNSMVVFTGGNGSLTLVAGSAPVLLPAGVGFTADASVQIKSIGTSSSLAFQPGAAVMLPEGTPGNDQIILSGSGTITQPGGTAVAFTPGTISLPAGALIQFDSSPANTNAAISFANGANGGVVPLALATAFQAGATFSNLPGGSKVVFTGGNGSLTLVSGSAPVLLPAGAAFTAGASARIESSVGGGVDASGLIVNGASSASIGANLPLFINGGSLTVQSNSLFLNSGSSINVSGGLYVGPSNKQTYGAAGAITLNAAVDLGNAQNSVAPENSQFVVGQAVELAGYSGLRSGAGTLNIQAPLVQIGGTSLVNGGTAQDSLLLPASFFSQGGFGTFSITGVGDSTDAQRASVLVAPGTVSNPNVIAPEVQSWAAQVNGGQYSLTPTTLPLESQRSPLSISLNAPGVSDSVSGTIRVEGNVVVGQGAIIRLDADPSNSVRLFGGSLGTVAVFGQIIVPGGTITIEADGNSNNIFNGGSPNGAPAPATTVDLEPGSILDASGATELTTNLLGFRTGAVLNGGTISVTGNIFAEQGSQILVNGAKDALAVSTGYSNASGNLVASMASDVSIPVDSNGGGITLKGVEALLTEATLSGQAGGPSAQGGSLTVASGSFFSSADIIRLGSAKPVYPNDATLVLTNNAVTYDSSGLKVSSSTGAIGIPLLTDPTQAANGILVTNPVTDADGKTIYGNFSAQEFAGTGLSSLNLTGNLEIAAKGGNISLTAASGISIASQGVILLDDPAQAITVSLTAPYVAMGAYYTPEAQQGQQQTTFANGIAIPPHIFSDPTTGNPLGLVPLPGKGTLDVNAATLVDVRDLSLQGFDTLNINQSGLSAGDVRGAGTIELQGAINIRAGQIYPATEATFTIAAYSGSINVSGAGQLPLLPYSAGGALNLYAATINQDGVLRAPMGVINLGASANTQDNLSLSNFDTATMIELGAGSVASVSLIDPVTKQALIVPYGTNQNGTNWIDPAGNDITLKPNGAVNGVLGIPLKQIFIVGNKVTDDAGAVIDVQGGGDLYSARWVYGTGGTLDILNADNAKGSFAVIAGYGAANAPLDPTPGYSATTSLSSTSLKVGDSVYLSGGSGLAAGRYTLLPAEYALLPGGYLVTKQSTGPVLAGSVPAEPQTDGSVLVTGYKYNGLVQTSAPSLYSTFEVASGSVVRARAEYDSFTANTFLEQTAVKGNQSVPRLPVDAGQLVFNATTQLLLQGSDTIRTSAGTITISVPSEQAALLEPVTIGTSTTGGPEDIAFAGTGTIKTSTMSGQGGLVDISSSSPIDILDAGTGAGGAIVLLTSQLNGLNAASLLIGGTRGTDGETVTVATADLEVNDHGNALKGQDLILVSTGILNIDSGSVISTPASDSSITPPPLIVEGNGALVRVSSGQNGQVTHANTDATGQSASLSISDAQISAMGGTSAKPLPAGTLELDSTGQFQLDAGASLPSVLSATTLTFNAGQISILFPNSGAPTPTNGLVLQQAQIQTLQQSTKNLNFLSYSSIDLYGSGALGTDASGKTVLENLSLAASQLRGYYYPSSAPNTGITFAALGSVTLSSANFQNGPPFNLAPVGANPSTSQLEEGLTVNAPTIQLGGGIDDTSLTVSNDSFAINGFQGVSLTAGKEILVLGTVAKDQATSAKPPQAVFNVVDGALDLNSPLITSETGSNLEILAGNDTTKVYQNISITSTGTPDPTLEQGLDGILLIKGANITDSGAIVMPSGQVTLEATSGDLTMSGSIDVSGAAPVFNRNVTKYTNGGTIALKADSGDLNLKGGAINVSAQSGVGTTAANAGSLTLQASGALLVDQTTTLHGQGGAVTSSVNGPVVLQGQNGAFSLDVANTNLTAEPGGPGMASDLGVLASILSPALGDFTQSQSIRIRGGDAQIAASTVVTANTFNLSADNGNVDVYGTINAAGVIGGRVEIDASGAVTLHGGSLVTVAGQRFADSGKGGAVTLQGGAYNGSVNPAANVTIASNSTVDLSVGSGDIVQLDQPASAITLSSPGTLILQSGLATGSSVTVAGSGGYVLTPGGTQTSFKAGDSLSSLPAGSMVIFTGGNGSMTLVSGSAPVLVPAGVGFATGSTVQLASSGTSSLAFQPGAAVTLPEGTPGNDQIILYGSGTITQPGAAAVPFTPGAVSLPAGSLIQFDSNPANTNAAIAFANGGAGGGIPLALAATDSLITPAPLGDATGSLKIIVPAANFGATGIVTQGNILSPSSIVLEGNQVYGNNSPSVTMDSTLQTTVGTDATNNVTTWASSIPTILGNYSSLAGLTTAGFGAEIVNAGGDLVLNSTWDLSSLSSAGIVGDLTLRASGNIILKGGVFGARSSTQGASLTDGFSSNPTAPWQATLLTTPSWSFNITAGADMGAADTQRVINGQGSLLVGYGGPSKTVDQASEAGGQSTTSSTQNIFTAYYQTIRTGTGNISISTGGDVQLLNALANIYTAGRQLSSGQTTSVLSTGDFSVPELTIPGSTTANQSTLGNRPSSSPYGAQYSWGGGDVSILADGNIEHLTQNGSPDSSRELPTSWLDRRGYTSNGVFADNRAIATLPRGITKGGIASTTWWVDFSNFFEGIGALGGGNVTLVAGGSVNNVDASLPTNARMAGKNSTGAGIAPNAGNLVELGGGDLVVRAGDNINGGVYYVERGTGALDAGYKIITNSTRATVVAKTQVTATPDPQSWLPTTLFVGAAGFNVSAGNDLEMGAAVNPFLLPQNISNSYLLKTYFSTFATSDAVNVESLTGNVTIQGSNSSSTGTIGGWYNNVLGFQSTGAQSWSYFQPWLALTETNPALFTTAATLLPPTLQVVAFSENSQGTSGNINLDGNLTLSPSPTGNLDLVAARAISGLSFDSASRVAQYATINLSDANPANIAGVASPLSLINPKPTNDGFWATTPTPANTGIDLFGPLNVLFTETASTTGLLQNKEALHASIIGSNGVAEPLHYEDSTPVQIDAGSGDISGLTLFSAKFAHIAASQDITDIGLYIQNTNPDNISVVAAGRDLIAYDTNSALRLGLESAYNLTSSQIPDSRSGDIQISGPGTIEVLAGQNFDLGVSTGTSSTGLGLTSIGNGRNPGLPFAGANIIAAAGLGGSAGLDSSNLDFMTFIADYLTPGAAKGGAYLSDLGALLGLDNAGDTAVRTAFDLLPQSLQDTYALAIFYDVLRDAGRDQNSGALNGGYSAGYAAIETLFPAKASSAAATSGGYVNTWPYRGDITLTSREIKTTNGGNISLLTPGGQVTVGLPINGSQTLEQGIFTLHGGNISIFANNNINVGVSRIFTLSGGNEIIWSSLGDIDAGASSKTVQSAPPTKVIVDPTSGDVQTDLAGLATGGGIGVLEAFAGAGASDVDLIAPAGTVNAGDAGIRASGNINVAAQQVLNSGNITAGGKSSGVPTTTAPNVAGIAAAASAAGSATQAGMAGSPANNQAQQQSQTELPSIIIVEILGYGGGDTD